MSENKTFLEPNCIEHEVGGEIHKFYPLSVRAMFRLKPVATVLAQSLATLFSSNKNDTTSRQLRQDNGAFMIENEAIDPTLARQRHDEQERALHKLFEALLDPKTAWVISMLIMDSMREEWPGYKSTEKEAKELVEQLSIDRLTECLVGVAKANRGVLDPLGLQSVTQVVTDRFRDKIVELERAGNVLESTPSTEAQAEAG